MLVGTARRRGRQRTPSSTGNAVLRKFTARFPGAPLALKDFALPYETTLTPRGSVFFFIWASTRAHTLRQIGLPRRVTHEMTHTGINRPSP